MEIGGLIFILFIVIACILVSSGESDERPIIDSSMEETGRPGYPSEGYKDFIRRLKINEDSSVASNGGIHFAEFLMKEFIDWSNKEILIFERKFPGELIITLLPELEHFAKFRGGSIRVLYVEKTDGYNKFVETLGNEVDIKIKRTNLTYFEDFGDSGIYAFDRKGTRVEYDTESHKSLYCFNDKKNASYIRDKFVQSGIL